MTDLALLLLLVALGGGVGGMARFWVSGMVARRWGETFPWGTLTVNVSGAAAIGMLAARLLEPGSHAGTTLPFWAALVGGLLGSYTTVSSLALQTLALARTGEPWRAALNVVGSLGGGLAAAAAGYLALLTLLARA